MKHIKQYFLTVFTICSFILVNAQNVSLNILTQNSGVVVQGNTVALEVTVCNSDGSESVPVYKLRPQISVPSAIVNIAATGHTLPAGWSIVSNTGSTIRISNGTDQVPPLTCRTILILLNGVTAGGPSTITGTMTFGNGVAPGSTAGSATNNDITGDNVSTSTITVSSPLPLNLISFNASLENCKPTLKWETENEINTSKFEIERTDANSITWVNIGTVNAKNTINKSTYTYKDATADNSKDKVLYRLKMIDRDGSFKYSYILPVNVNCNKVNFSVFPNPVKDGRLLISLSGARRTATATLLSTAGQLISKTNLSNGTNQLDVSKVATGVYILKVEDDNGFSKNTTVYIQR
jgi:hypothetical protein